MLYCRWIHVPLFLSSSWKLVMQSALFCGTLPLAETPFKKFPFSSDFSFHPFQALFTRPAPLTSSSPSYHSSVGGEAGFRELRKGRGDLTDSQTWIVRLMCSSATVSWEKKAEKNRKEREANHAHKLLDDMEPQSCAMVLPHMTLVNPLQKTVQDSHTSETQISQKVKKFSRHGHVYKGLCRCRGRSDWEERQVAKSATKGSLMT